MRNLQPMKSAFLRAAAATAALAVLALVTLAAATPASATPAIAKATGQPCTKCHSPSPPALNDYGKKYKESH